MRLEDLNLDVSSVVGAPVKITAPQTEWLQARSAGVIPEGLFKLYEAAGYLSFDAAPKFLADPDHLLFSYFAMLLRGVRRQLSDGVELLNDLTAAHSLLYDPIKEAKGLPWDPSADRRSKRAFRELVVTACSTLDMTADLVALMFTGCVPSLSVGRAQFVSIEDWLRKPAQATGAILTPRDAALADLRTVLTPLVLPDGPERDWLPLVRMLRNKGAHLGDDVFRYFGLFGIDDRLYLFVPREWPYFFEQHLKPAGQGTGQPFPEFLLRTLIHEDYISFAAGLSAKIRRVVGTASEILHAAFKSFAGFNLNETALVQLKNNSRAYSFERFTNAGTSIAGITEK